MYAIIHFLLGLVRCSLFFSSSSVPPICFVIIAMNSIIFILVSCVDFALLENASICAICAFIAALCCSFSISSHCCCSSISFSLFVSAFLFRSSFDCLYSRRCCCISKSFSCLSAFCCITSSTTESTPEWFLCFDVLLLLLEFCPKVSFVLGVSTTSGASLGESSLSST